MRVILCVLLLAISSNVVANTTLLRRNASPVFTDVIEQGPQFDRTREGVFTQTAWVVRGQDIKNAPKKIKRQQVLLEVGSIQAKTPLSVQAERIDIKGHFTIKRGCKIDLKAVNSL